MRAWVVGLVLLVSSTAAATPGAVLVPPGEVEIGAGSPVGDATAGTSTEVRAGVHWAAMCWKPTRFDVGVGYVGSFRSTRPIPMANAERMLDPEDDNTLGLHGVYLSAAYAIESHEHWRTWIGGRFELLAGDIEGHSEVTTAVALRVQTEVFTAGIAGLGSATSAGVFAGAFAIGVYVEGLRRGLPTELGPLGVAAGLTMKIPFIAAIGT
jgi:hypothetical protein